MAGRILLITRSRLLARYVEGTIQSSFPGYHVVFAKRGLEGVRLTPATSPCLILIDDGLDDIASEALLTNLASSESGGRAPVVLMHGANLDKGRMDELKKRYAHLGFLKRPFEPEDLVACVMEALKKLPDEAATHAHAAAIATSGSSVPLQTAVDPPSSPPSQREPEPRLQLGPQPKQNGEQEGGRTESPQMSAAVRSVRGVKLRPGNAPPTPPSGIVPRQPGSRSSGSTGGPAPVGMTARMGRFTPDFAARLSEESRATFARGTADEGQPPPNTIGFPTVAPPAIDDDAVTARDGSSPNMAASIRAIEMRRATGCLEVAVLRQPCEVYFMLGRPIVTTTKDPVAFGCSPSTARLLRLHEDDLNICSQVQMQTGCPFFLTLARGNLLTMPEAIRFSIQQGTKLFSYTWKVRHPALRWRPLDSLPEFLTGVKPMEENVDQWMLTSLRHLGPKSVSDSLLPKPVTILRTTDEAGRIRDRLDLTRAEQRFLTSVDGRTPLRDLAEKTSMSLDVTQIQAFKFANLGILDPVSAPLPIPIAGQI